MRLQPGASAWLIAIEGLSYFEPESGRATTSSASQYASLRARFAALKKQVTVGVPGAAQSRGRAIERLLRDLLDVNSLDPLTGYRTRGEEIASDMLKQPLGQFFHR